ERIVRVSWLDRIRLTVRQLRGAISQTISLARHSYDVGIHIMGHGHCARDNRDINVRDMWQALHRRLDFRGATCAIHAFDTEFRNTLLSAHIAYSYQSGARP